MKRKFILILLSSILLAVFTIAVRAERRSGRIETDNRTSKWDLKSGYSASLCFLYLWISEHTPRGAILGFRGLYIFLVRPILAEESTS